MMIVVTEDSSLTRVLNQEDQYTWNVFLLPAHILK